MELEISFPSDVDKICRSCMSVSNDMYSIFSKAEALGHDEFISDMLMACAAVQISVSDGLPGVICAHCIQQLSIAYNFKQRCEKTESDLHEILKVSSEISVSNETNEPQCILQLILKPSDEVQIKDDISNLTTCDAINKNIETLSLLHNFKESSSDLESSSNVKNEPPHVCDLCDEPFKTSADLKGHIETHVNEINFNVDEFKASSDKREDECSNHSDYNKKIKRYFECKICNKSFTRAFTLKKHLKLHETNSPVTDDGFDYSCRTREDNDTDRVKVQRADDDPFAKFEKKLFSCEYCDYLCIERIEFDDHMRAHQGNEIYIKQEDNFEDNVNSKQKVKKERDSACKLCNKNVPNTQSLCLHLKKRKKVLTYSCSLCNKSFKTSQNLNRHILLHTDGDVKTFNSVKNAIGCDICDQSFNTQYQLMVHYQKHISTSAMLFDFESKAGIAESKTVSCYICTRNFFSIAELNNHKRRHTVDSNYACRVCDETFDDRTGLTEHLNNRTAHSIPCNVCLLEFNSSRDFDAHLKIHSIASDKISYKCAVCEDVFKSRSVLMSHLVIHFDASFKCSRCHSAFKDLESLNAHEKRHSDPKFLCSLCGYRFQTKSRLTSHVLRHNNEKPYICSICNKGYSSKAVLKIHERIHTNYKPYVCSYCGYSCCQSGDLQMHVRTHTGEKPYTCPFPNCDRRFTTSSHRKEHIRRHTGERNHKCTVCSKAFSESKTLKTHMLTHSGLRPFSCEICGKTFRRKHHRVIHMKQHA